MIVSLEIEVCSCAELQVFLTTKAERKHVRRREPFQQHRDASCIQVLFFLQTKAQKEIHVILKVTLGEYAPSYSTVKNWVAHFKRGDFSTCDAPRPGRHKTVTTTEIIDQIHELVSEDGHISAKSIAEQLGITLERVGSIINEDLDMRKLSAKWVPKCLNSDEKFNGFSRLSKFWNFFGAIQMISCRDWWQWTNLVILLWSGDKATISGWRHSDSPRPKKFRLQKSAGKDIALIFFWIKTASS